jgi:hypothetical protein
MAAILPTGDSAAIVFEAAVLNICPAGVGALGPLTGWRP